MRLEVVAIGMMMGVAFAAPPGVVTAETLRRGLRGGFGHALSVQLGSLIGDASYALLALAGVAAFLQTPLAQTLFGSAGALFLLYLAWQSLKTSAGWQSATDKTGGNYRESFLSGMLLSLTNPWAIAFWLSLGGSFVALGLQAATDLPWVFASFMLGSLAWSFVLAGLIERGRHWLSPKLFHITSIACGLLLAAFAISVGARVVSMLLA